MEGFLHAVSSVTIILLLTATGYFCAARGWMGPQAKAFIGKFTLSVAIPCMSVYGLTNNLTRDLLVQSGRSIYRNCRRYFSRAAFCSCRCSAPWSSRSCHCSSAGS